MSPSNLLLHLATLTSVRKQERNLSLPREALGENKSFKAKTASNVYPEDSNPAPKSSTACDSKSVQTGLSREAVAGARPPRPPRPPRFPSHTAGRLISTRRAAREAWEWSLCGGGGLCPPTRGDRASSPGTTTGLSQDLPSCHPCKSPKSKTTRRMDVFYSFLLQAKKRRFKK